MKKHNELVRRRIAQILSVIGREIGFNNERRVVSAFTTEYPYPNKPSWLIAVHLSNRFEDTVMKSDVVFVTDVGIIDLQVKSGKRNAFLFARAQEAGLINPNILLAVISPELDSKQICKKILPLLSRRRIELLQK